MKQYSWSYAHFNFSRIQHFFRCWESTVDMHTYMHISMHISICIHICIYPCIHSAISDIKIMLDCLIFMICFIGLKWTRKNIEKSYFLRWIFVCCAIYKWIWTHFPCDIFKSWCNFSNLEWILIFSVNFPWLNCFLQVFLLMLFKNEERVHVATYIETLQPYKVFTAKVGLAGGRKVH